MIRPRLLGIILSVVGLAGPATAQLAPSPTAQAPLVGPRAGMPTGGVEVALLRSLQANPATSIYAFSAERRGSKIALRGRVGTKQAHDAAIRTALALGVPVIDDLVIDTLAAHQAAAYAGAMGYGGGGMGSGSGPAGPSSGLGAYPGATSAYTALPYTYPQPLFGKLDEPFYGFEPPVLGYPAWWGAMSYARVGPPANAQPQPLPPTMANPNPNASMAAPAVDPNAAQAANLPDGTIDMAIDPRGVATLRGSVPTLGERITLGQRVAQTPGVTQVINLLNVKPGLTVVSIGDKPPPPPVPADLPVNGARPNPAPAPANNNDGAAAAGDPSDPVGSRASRAIANRSGLDAKAVKVKVRDGVATLSGKVPTVYEAMLAYRAVQRTPGVREVEDHLEFTLPDGNGPNPLADRGRPEDVEPYLEAQIRRQLGDLAHLDRVRIQGDSLDLRGTLEREDDRPRFDAILRSMPILRGFRVAADMPAESR